MEAGPGADAKWFAGGGCVVPEGDRFLVFVRGTLIGSFVPMDRGVRNAIIIGLAEDPKVHLGQLAAAFDISDGTLRLLRGIHESKGMGPLLSRAPGGSLRAQAIPVAARFGFH